jgi:hypothetical protein
VYRDAVSTNNLGRPLLGKACHRGHPEVVVSHGNHAAVVPGRESRFKDPLIEILHFPMRSLKQFQNKIAVGGHAYEQSPELEPKLGGTWRSLHATLNREGLEHHYEASCLAPQGLPRMLQDGTLVLDERLRNFMRSSHASRAPLPGSDPQGG